MEITAVKINKFEQEDSNLKAFASVTLDDEFVVTGIKVVKGSKGLFVSMPSTKWDSDDKYHDICFPVTKDFREELAEEIIEAYKEEKNKKKSSKKNRKKDEEDFD